MGATMQDIAAVRRFNRFYTRQIGVLEDGLLESAFSLTEVRVMYELAHQSECTASDLIAQLGLDHGYLSRILRRLRARKLLQQTRSSVDQRRLLLTLSASGRRAFAPLEARANAQVGNMLQGQADEQLRELLQAMRSIEQALAPTPPARRGYVLHEPHAGDYGWIIGAHGELYGREFGWSDEIEKLAAQIVAGFVSKFDPATDRCWIAESERRRVGCVLVVRETRSSALLRLLLVTPEARGLGIGARLVEECVHFARQAGYRTLKLWTQSNLTSARKLYQQQGFKLVEREPHHSFGKDLTGERWELRL